MQEAQPPRQRVLTGEEARDALEQWACPTKAGQPQEPTDKGLIVLEQIPARQCIDQQGILDSSPCASPARSANQLSGTPSRLGRALGAGGRLIPLDRQTPVSPCQKRRCVFASPGRICATLCLCVPLERSTLPSFRLLAPSRSRVPGNCWRVDLSCVIGLLLNRGE